MAKNSAWVITGKIIIFALSFAFMTGLANLSSKEVVGTYNYVISILAIVSISTLPGMGTALVRAVARGHEGSFRSMTRLRLLFGLVGSAIALVIAGAYFLHGNTTLGWLFVIGALFVPLTDTISEMTLLFFQGRKNFSKSMLVAVLCQAVFSLSTLGVLFFTDNIITILSTFWISQAIAGVTAYLLTKPKNNTCDVDSEAFGFHLTAMTGLRIVAINIDRVFVWGLFGPAAVAVYTIASVPIMKLEQLVPVEALALPTLSTESLTHRIRKKLITQVGMLTVALVPFVIVGYFLAPFAFSLFFPTFSSSVPLFQLLLIILLFTPFTLLKAGLTAWRKQRALYTIDIASPIIRICLYAILGSILGLPGIVLATIGAKSFETVLTTILFMRLKTHSQ